LLDRDRRIAPALVRCGANELDHCSHAINPPDISLPVMFNWTGHAARANPEIFQNRRGERKNLRLRENLRGVMNSETHRAD